MAAGQTRAFAVAMLSFAACAHPRVAPMSAPDPVSAQPVAAAIPSDSTANGVTHDGAIAPPAGTPSTSVAPGDTTRDAKLDSLSITIDDIARKAVELFGDSALATTSSHVGNGARVSTDSAPTWDIDVRSYETRQSVTRYVSRFTGGARETFEDWLMRGSRYDAMIRAKLRARGIPEDMTYLALVESGYDPQAYSRAAAVGMWQFMAGTAREAGMRVDWWVDERRDPVKSTDVAIRFLAELREQFGSLYLAATAYNGGPGRLARGLSRFADDLEGTSGDDVFFALAEKDYLPTETKNYVPQIIAAALIAKEPARYGIHVRTLPAFAYDSILVAPSTPLGAIAHAAGLPVADIADLNPHILRGVTPPDVRFLVRVPVGAGASLDSALRALDDDSRAAYRRVTIKKSESLASLARREGVSAKQLGWYNPKAASSKKGTLHSGQVMLVPTALTLAAARDVPDPGIERVRRRGARGSRSAPTVHLVKHGETLGLLASRYHTSVSEIARLNHLKKHVIYPGQEIVVRGGRASSSSESSTANKKSRSSATSGSSATKKKTASSKKKRRVS